MSVIRRLANVAYGKVKTTVSPSGPPDLDDAELRPSAEPSEPSGSSERRAEAPEEPAPEPVSERPATPRPRRL